MKYILPTLLNFLMNLTYVNAQVISLDKLGIKDFLPEDFRLLGNVKTVKIYNKTIEKLKHNIDNNGFQLSTIYHLNKSKKLISDYNYFILGEHHNTYYYKNDSIPLGYLSVYTRNSNGIYRDTSFTYYNFDNSQHLLDDITVEVNRPNIRSFKSYKYEKNKDKLLVDLFNYSTDSLLVYQIRTSFDANGNEIETKGLYDGFSSKRYNSEVKYKYIKIGNVYKLKRKDIDSGHYREYYDYTYDDLGRVIEEIEAHASTSIKKYIYGIDGSFEVFEDDYTYGKNMGYAKYDNWGNLVFKGYLDKKTRILRNDYYHLKYKYEYDTHGNWTARYEYSKEDPSIKEFLKAIIHREIEYYKESEESLISETVNYKLVDFALLSVRKIPEYAKEKRLKLLEYQQLLKEGKYGKDFTLKKAKKIEDFTPLLWTIVQEVNGNIIDDSTSEKVVIYEKPHLLDNEPEHCLAIFYQKSGSWELKEQFFNLIQSYQFGGESAVEIDRKCIVISNAGANWEKTYRYRFQNNDFYLIGVTISNGKCDEYSTFDYNLNTGKVEYNHNFEDCSEEENLKTPKNIKIKLYKKGLKIPLMRDFFPDTNQIEIIKGEEVIY